jgi:hypothetical protein
MKSITILSINIIALLTMSFNSIHSKKYLELNKKENLQNSNTFIGLKNTIIIGTSATAFPGNIRMVTDSHYQNLSEKKLNIILNKYNN